MKIGLTGGIGSGKTTVAQCFRELGVVVIDSDQITRQLVEPNRPALQSIAQHFGPEILEPDGTLNRARLRARIFASLSDRRWLENLLHPLVKAEIERQAQRIPSGTYLVVEVPLLIEAHFQDAVDRILVIDCSLDIQKERAAHRDGSSPEIIQSIIDSQATRSERLTMANDVLENNGSLKELKRKVQTLHHYYIELSK